MLVKMPSVVLFDWDDTVIQTWPFLWQLYQRTFQQFGKNITDFFDEATCKEYAVRHGRKTFTDVFGEQMGQKACAFFLKIYKEESLNSLVPLDDAKDTLAFLQSQNIPMAVVSNKESIFLKKEMTHLGFYPYFQSIVGRDRVGPKPSPEPVYCALKEMELHEKIEDKKTIWFIGDTQVDEETAHAVGCTFIGFGDFFQKNDEKTTIKIGKSVANWSQFHSLLSDINLKCA